jgi:hypothetical protein
MTRQPSSGFNKEKLIFICMSMILATSVYSIFSSRPVELTVGTPVSPVPLPGPLTPDRLDTRKALVKYYLESGKFGDVTVDRERKNPFEPIDDFMPAAAKMAAVAGPKKIVNIPPPRGGPTPMAAERAPDPPAPKEDKKEEAKVWEPKADPKALVDFSAVVTMNGITYGLLKSKGQTIRVQVGDYLEDYKYTVAKIDTSAIWVTDENDREFVARDTSFDDSGASGGDGTDDKPKPKKDKSPAKDAKPVPAAAPAKPAQKNNNTNGNNNANNGNNNGNNNNGNNNNGNNSSGRRPRFNMGNSNNGGY